jgi:hypothetical protein
MKNKIYFIGLLTILGMLFSLASMQAQERTSYYYNYDYLTNRFQDMRGEDLVCYSITSHMTNSVKRDSLRKQIVRYKTQYPNSKITVVFASGVKDTNIYTQVTRIKDFETANSLKFDGYNFEREYWNGVGTFNQWCSWLRLIKQRLGSCEAYLGSLTQLQSDSIVTICNRIYLHNYYTNDKWSGKYCIDNDNKRLKYIANSAYHQQKVFEVLPLLANNEQSNPTGFQTSYLIGDAIAYCYHSYKKAFDNAPIQYKNQLNIRSVVIYKKL